MSSRNIANIKVPFAVYQFLLKALICLICWQSVYQLLLKPERHLDRHLTHITASATASILSTRYGHSETTSKPRGEVVIINDVAVIRIADGCNGLDLFILYSAFLICMPGKIKRQIIFILLGVLFIFVLNVLRCCTLAWLKLNYPLTVDFAHHYLFSLIVYSFIFFMFVLYTRHLTTAPSR